MLLGVLAAVVCVLANAFFVAAEFSLVKVRRTQLETLARKGDVRAARALDITQRLDEYLSATQVGVTFASLALGWVGEPAFAELITAPLHWAGVRSEGAIHVVALTVGFGAITMLHIVVGELAPKYIAIQSAERLALVIALPLRMFFIATYPFLWVLNKLSTLALRAFGRPAIAHAEGALSAEEIRLVVSRGQLDDTKRELLERVLRSADRPVRAIMVPRVDMVTLSTADSIEVNLARARQQGFSRYVLIEGRDPDKVVGYVYLKDMLLTDRMPRGGLAALRRDILFVPEGRTVSDVLEDFKRRRIPIAIVVDEYGGTSGLITLEDIVEEIVGELQDEHDAEVPRIVEQEDGSLVADGLVPVGDLAAVVGEIQDVDNSETIGGYVVRELHRLARPGDQLRVGTFDVTVEDVRKRRVTRVRLMHRTPSLTPPPHDEPEDATD